MSLLRSAAAASPQWKSEMENTYQIWISGTTEGVNGLLKGFEQRTALELDFSRRDSIIFTWRGTQFYIQSNESGYLIAVHATETNSPADVDCLNDLYSNVIEPLKDITGGVAAGTGYSMPEK